MIDLVIVHVMLRPVRGIRVAASPEWCPVAPSCSGIRGNVRYSQKPRAREPDGSVTCQGSPRAFRARRTRAARASSGVSTGRSEEHTSELQSLMRISYAVFCLKQKTEKKKILKSLLSKYEPYDTSES